MQPSSFWQEALLRGFSSGCIWHAVIPTIMVSKCPAWDVIKDKFDTTDTQVVLAQRSNMCCAKCGASQEGKVYRCGVRVLVTTCKTYDGFHMNERMGFRIVFNSATLCLPCIDKDMKMPCLDANSDMLNHVLDQLEDIALSLEISRENYKDGPTMWRTVLNILHSRHKKIMHTLGKMDCKCPYCKNPLPKKRCSGCHYVRYCGSNCSVRDWSKHKIECEFLQKSSLFLSDEFTFEEKI
jgi:hypothetical protein